MIRIERGPEIAPGVFAYSVPSLRLSGKSRQPLLDACRAIQSILGDPCREQAAAYREGRDAPDLTCPVDIGARYRVADESRGSPRFRKFEAFDPSAIRARAAVTTMHAGTAGQ
jgi:hypothetical protein